MKGEKNIVVKIINMLKKKKICAFIKLLIFLLILYICFSIVNNVTKRKYSYEKYNDFFKQQEDFDVLFFGSSHVLYSVLPMQLWNDYGIISYNMADTGERIPTSYYSMKLACKETKPKLVIIDAFFADLQEKLNKNCAHNLFDVYPISMTKYLAIQDLSNSNEKLNDYVEYLFNFSMYHERWRKLTKADFKMEKDNFKKGASILVKVTPPNKTNPFENVKKYNGEETIGMEYLRKIIEYCKENNIEVLVTYLPFPAEDKLIGVSKYVSNICEEYDVKYINFLEKEVVDYETDMFDSSSHLNILGAKKITDYLGKYIMENYNVLDQRSNRQYEFWYEDYNDYINFKIDNLKKNNRNLNNYLILLYGEEDIKYEIEVSSKKEIKEGSVLQKLLLNLNNSYEINDKVFEEHQDKTVKITTYDNRDGKIIDTVWF